MKKNNKGFTLVELLAILAILGIIAGIAIPNMTAQINNNDKNTQTVLDEKIENAAKIYAAKYYADKLINGSCTNETCAFTLNDLVQDGLINLNGQCSGYMKSENVITVTGNTYNYEKIKGAGCYSTKKE